MEKRSLDRRTFVMGASALGATAFAGGVLGGCVAEGPSTVEPASPEPAPEPLSYDSVFPPVSYTHLDVYKRQPEAVTVPTSRA